jgi:N-methylhydantoinase A
MGIVRLCKPLSGRIPLVIFGNKQFGQSNGLRIGIDIGGTFTDFVIYDPQSGKLSSLKLPSTPSDPSQAVLQGLSELRLNNTASSKSESVTIIHGSTVATNALLERKGAPTALVTTRGFADVLQIGRQNRPELYDLFADPPEPLIPALLRLEVPERVGVDGKVITSLDPAVLDPLVTFLASQDVRSVAVCLLFSFLYPPHEQLIAQRLRREGFLVSVSSEIMPEYREFERMSTTVINAFVSPEMDQYLSKLETALHLITKNVSLRLMQSNGGLITVDEARRFSVRCILSGPAGGVSGSQFVGAAASQRGSLKLITFDMGGTSTDVSLIDHDPVVTTEATVGGFPIRIPILDIHTIGAGGGSIASVDLGGALRVGPRSAGADPGPACYGRFDIASHPEMLFPTVTDANLVLGRLAPEFFLGGRMPLYPQNASFVMDRLGQEIGLSAVETALGVIAVANAHMERALRLISVERGHDPQDFILFSFGGAGGLHAVDLARKLGIPQVLISPYASTLSALGMLASDFIKDYSQTVMLPGSVTADHIEQRLSPLIYQAQSDLSVEGFSTALCELHPSLDMRYRGQSFELTVPFAQTDNFLVNFHTTHQNTYGYSHPSVDPDEVEIVNIRLHAIGKIPRPMLPVVPRGSSDSDHALLNYRQVFLDVPESQAVPFYQSELLLAGNVIAGPAVILCADTTILLNRGDVAAVDDFQNILITVNCS